MYEFLDYQTQDVMTREMVTVAPSAKLAEAAAMFSEHDFNSLPVVDESKALVGVVTKLDMLSAFRFDDEHMFPPYAEIMQRRVATIMTRDVRTVWPRTPLHKVLRMMVEFRCKSFPVVDDGNLVGIVAREDVMRGLVDASRGKQAERPGDPY